MIISESKRLSSIQSQISFTDQKRKALKNVDPNLGFKVFNLSIKEVNKATKMMQSEFSNHIGPAGKRKNRKTQ